MFNPNHCRGQQFICRLFKVEESWFLFLSPNSLLVGVIQHSNKRVIWRQTTLFRPSKSFIALFFPCWTYRSLFAGLVSPRGIPPKFNVAIKKLWTTDNQFSADKVFYCPTLLLLGISFTICRTLSPRGIPPYLICQSL